MGAFMDYTLSVLLNGRISHEPTCFVVSPVCSPRNVHLGPVNREKVILQSTVQESRDGFFLRKLGTLHELRVVVKIEMQMHSPGVLWDLAHPQTHPFATSEISCSYRTILNSVNPRTMKIDGRSR